MAATPVLLLVPDPVVSKYLARVLAGSGFPCRPVVSVADALEALAAGGEYAVLVVDGDLLGGEEQAWLAESRRRHPAVPIVALDSMCGHHEALAASAPFDAVVPKPFVLTPLLDALRRLAPRRGDATAS